MGDINGSFVHDLCVRLSELGVDLSVLAPRSRTPQASISSFPIRRYPYLPFQSLELLPESTMKGAQPWRIAQLPFYLASSYLHLRSGDPDILHCHLAIPIGFAASLLPVKRPLLITCHGSDCTLPFDNPAYMPFTRHALSNANMVVTVSRHIEGLARRLGARRVETIHLGVDTEKFVPSKNPSLKRSLGIPEGTKVVGTLGRLVHEKRVEDILRGVELAATKIDVALIVGGDGPDRRRLMRLANDIGIDRIVFTGLVRDAPSFHQLLDVFVLASSREGLSISLQEAMASGVVPVATNGFGNNELVRNGVNGYTFEVGDVRQMSEKIIMAANNSHMGVAARETIVKNFDAGQGADKYLELYQNLVSS